MQKTIVSLISLALILSQPVFAVPPSDSSWELEKEKDDITVYLRQTELSPIKEFYGYTTLSTTTEELLSLYMDAEACSQWVPTCALSFLVDQPSANEFTLYQQLKTPWPLKNRDYLFTNHVTTYPDTGEVVIVFSDIPDSSQYDGCCTRAVRYQGQWRFIPNGNEQVTVIYQNSFDPGGFPAAVVNSAIVDMPIDTLVNMRRLLEQ
ncbi:START domain-containing protein [Salinispirillum marinum]|uniref:START domain-containing protein n=2 Tax=Saccharospirillaceae TaxID=255527 RepID=A0ABV8BHX5_9GAMM